MTILDRLNSGKLHTAARKRRPDCVDAKGNIHATPERAAFVNWLYRVKAIYGDDIASWPEQPRKEYDARYVPSH